MTDSETTNLHGALAMAAMAGGVTTGGLMLGLTENFGKLRRDGKIAPSATSDAMVGSYAQGLTAASLATIVFSVMSIVSTAHQGYIQGMVANMLNALHGGTALTLTVVLVTAGLAMYVLDNFENIDSFEMKPADIEADQKIRGSMGWAMYSMSIITIILAGSMLLPLAYFIMYGAVGFLAGRRSSSGSSRSKSKRSEGIASTSTPVYDHFSDLGIPSYGGI